MLVTGHVPHHKFVRCLLGHETHYRPVVFHGDQIGGKTLSDRLVGMENRLRQFIARINGGNISEVRPFLRVILAYGMTTCAGRFRKYGFP